jgi:hypothetical protein
MKKINLCKGLAWWIALAATLAFSFWSILPFFSKTEQGTLQKTIITVWNVDTFEGGKGSRTAFLNSVAKKMEGDVYFMVSSKTVEGIEYALLNGEQPDMLSFGVGVQISQAVEASVWCRGKYVLFSKEGEKSSPNGQNTVMSRGGRNEPIVAAALYGLSGEISQESSLQAYMDFLNGKYAYLLGTQRDAQRFLSRGVAVEATPLNDFTDLCQYIAVMKEENRDVCERFVAYLQGADVQSRLSEIGMFSPYRRIYGAGELLCKAIEQGELSYVWSATATLSQKETLCRMAEKVLLGEESCENLKNFLKGSGNTFKKVKSML